ncbi:MAG TPA: hypothetical protein VMU25_00775 [Candidatus Paceibacterota bacterium]|nr:hypothetical protein [Candidatus Paceibacterota bacterium]
MATKTEKKPAPKIVTVDSKVRAKYPWLDEFAAARKATALDERRKKEQANGKLLSVDALKRLADEYEKIQRQINDLKNDQEKIRDMMLLPHWGHTGIQEIESSLGNTLFVPGWTLGLDQDVVQRRISRESWYRNSERVLKPMSLIAEGDTATKKAPRERAAIMEALRVAKFQIAIIPPSSRRQKSGQSAAQDEHEEEVV